MGGPCAECGRHADPVDACVHCGNVPRDPDPIAAAKQKAAEIKKRTELARAEAQARIEAEADKNRPRKDAA